MIFYIADPHFYNHYTITYGIEAFARLIGQPVAKLSLGSTFTRYTDECLLILEGYQFRGESRAIDKCGRDVDRIREVFPKSKIIVFGSYSNHCADYIEYNHPSKVDLHLDTSYGVARSMRERGIVADMFLWSGSQEVYDLASKSAEQTLLIQRDLLCLTRCNPSFHDRYMLLTGLQNMGVSVGYNLLHVPVTAISGVGIDFLEAWSLEGVFNQYKMSEFALGTTTPSSDKERNGKGFRDWIAPFLNCLLIHDDYEGYIDLYKDIVPMYKYGDVIDIIHTMNTIRQDPEQRKQLLEKQRDFARKNTIELQLLRAYKKYIVKSDVESPILIGV